MTFYVPRHFADDDRARAVRAMREQSFALVISSGAEGSEPFVTHCPLVVDDAGTRIVGHLARANPHWKLWEQGGRVLVVFPGAHAYVSPSWYESRAAVPTWNYVAVHAAGPVRILESREQRHDALIQLVKAHEPAFLEQWNGQDEDFRVKLLDAIVAFEVGIERLDVKLKLSQNRSAADRASVIEHLDTARDDEARSVARWMKDLDAAR